MNYKFDTLYSRDSKGKILQWNIEVQRNGSQVDIKKSYGELNGGQAIRWEKDIQGVNIGKSNETNPYEQAISQAQSAFNRKKKAGYVTLKEAEDNYETQDTTSFVSATFTFKNLTDDNRDKLYVTLDKYLPKFRTDASGNAKPMKCQQYYRTKKNWTDPYGKVWTDRKYFYILNPSEPKEKGSIITKFPCYGQYKVNGVRVLARYEDKVVMTSKEGDEFIVAHINDFFNMNPDIFEYNGQPLVLDGELYIHGELLQDIGSAVKKPNLNTPRITFELFDLAIEGVTNAERWKIIKTHILPKLEQHLNCPIRLVRTVLIKNDLQAQNLTDTAIREGHEGGIFRNPQGEYGFGKRPTIITKLKRTISREFKIVDIIPQKKDRTKGQFICITQDGLRFDVNPMGKDDYKRQLLLNRNAHIGKSLQCSFYEWTKDNKPFHIIENTIRDYE